MSAAFWRTGDFTGNEVAGVFSRIFDDVFLKAHTSVLDDSVSMRFGGVDVSITMNYETERWEGSVAIGGQSPLEDFDTDFDTFEEVANWLVIVRHAWDTELRPLGEHWNDEGYPLPRPTHFRLGAVAEVWAYRTVRLPLTVFYQDHHRGWFVGYGRNPQEARVQPLHGPWGDIKHAKLFAENWAALDHIWVPENRNSIASVDAGRLLVIRKGPDGWKRVPNSGQSPQYQNPLDAIMAFEQLEREKLAATRI